MTTAKYCSPEVGQILAANKGRRVRVGHRFGIIEYNHWVEEQTGPRHQVSLDLQTDSAGYADADAECEEIIRRLFPELFA